MVLLSERIDIFGTRDIPPDVMVRIKGHNKSKEIAKEYFNAIYGKRATSVIIANVFAAYAEEFRTAPSDFEEAWSKLSYQTTSEIVFRAVNHLPCSNKDTGEMEDFLNKKSHCGNSDIPK